MLEAVGEGLQVLLNPVVFGFLVLGVCIGLSVGAIPGLNATVGLAVLLPMIWGMPAEHALPMMVGLLAATGTGDTIPAVLFGTPGDTSATATMMDGYPLAKKGQAARVLGASFSASMLGGLFGAFVLTISIPIVQPLLEQWLSPEFFMLCMLGVVLVGGLTGKAPLKGIFAGGLGVLLSTIGMAPSVGYNRFTFDLPYLSSGLSLVVVALGLMAMPEITDMFIKGTKIASGGRAEMGMGIWRGYRDTFENLSLVLRSCLIGAWIGFAPGIGGSASVWMAYSQTVATCEGKPKRDKKGQIIDGYDGNFGRGDIRGVVGVEGANNATRGGDLIPTLMFGIPGSSPMALLLMAMIVIGITPGRSMVDPNQNLHVTFTIIWSLALGNVLATGICTFLTRPMASLTKVNVHYLLPFILLFVVMGAFQATSSWGDLIALVGMGTLGWVMKRVGWPRPPLLIGFVLGTLAEKYLWLSVTIFGVSWFWRPWVLGMFGAMIISLWFIIRSTKKGTKIPAGVSPPGEAGGD